MCGIAGYYGREAYRFDNHHDGFLKCKELMYRRGPDNINYFVDDKCLLIHSRLKVLDFSDAANQPFLDLNYVMVFNGELYNYVEIREKLKKNIEFYTQGDNEVMFQLFSHSSIKGKCVDGLKEAEGMWAIAFYDRQYKELTLIRDRFGEKPLWIYEKDDGVYFGSEIKYIKALSGDNLKINYDHLINYLVFGYRSLFNKDADNFYENIHQLAPGGFITYGSVNNHMSSYNDSYIYIGEDDSLTYDDCVEGTRERLRNAVKISTGRVDTDVAYLLSGGIDSNAIVSTAKDLDQKIDAFSIIDNGVDYSEQKIIHEAVKYGYKDCNHTFIGANSENFIDNLRDIIRYHEAPMCTVSYYVHWLLLKEIAKRGYKIVVSGTGGDELFAGYYDHFLYWFYEANINGWMQEQNKTYEGWYNGLRPHIRNEIFRDHLYFNGTVDIDCIDRQYLYPDQDKYIKKIFRKGRMVPTESSFYKRNPLRNRMLNELFFESIPPILFEDDLNSSYFSLENRSPLLNKELFEFSLKIPTKYLLKDGYGKAVLRDAIRPYAPECVVNQRKKVGFNASLKDLLVDSDCSWMTNNHLIYEFVNKDEILKLYNKMVDVGLTGDENKFLFSFISSKIFLEECN